MPNKLRASDRRQSALIQRRVVGALAIAVACSGCTGTPGSQIARLSETGRLMQEGAPARMTAAAIEETRINSVPTLYAFAVESGQITANPQETWIPEIQLPAQQRALLKADIDWKKITLVGEGYIDAQCNKFLSALDELERNKRGMLANLSAVQSATVGVMGLALAAQQAIGIVGIAFGLATSLFDNTTAIVLYQLPASSIRSVVQAQRDALRRNEQVQFALITNQGMASGRLAEYVQYCTPITIEANVIALLSRTEEKDGKIQSTETSPAIMSNLVSETTTSLPMGPIKKLGPMWHGRRSLIRRPKAAC